MAKRSVVPAGERVASNYPLVAGRESLLKLADERRRGRTAAEAQAAVTPGLGARGTAARCPQRGMTAAPSGLAAAALWSARAVPRARGGGLRKGRRSSLCGAAPSWSALPCGSHAEARLGRAGGLAWRPSPLAVARRLCLIRRVGKRFFRLRPPTEKLALCELFCVSLVTTFAIRVQAEGHSRGLLRLRPPGEGWTWKDSGFRSPSGTARRKRLCPGSNGDGTSNSTPTRGR